MITLSAPQRAAACGRHSCISSQEEIAHLLTHLLALLAPGDYCSDPAGASNFLFELRPNHVYERYDTTGSETSYQWAAASSDRTGLPGDWPNFGQHEDLNIGYGYGDPPGAVLARCNQGGTYRGRPDEICGGGYDTWNARGETQLEVWYITD